MIDAQKKHIESLDNAIRLLEDQHQKTPITQQEEPKKKSQKDFLEDGLDFSSSIQHLS